MIVVPAPLKDTKDQNSGHCYKGKERNHQVWLGAVERPLVELAVGGAPQEAHLFLFVELVMMEPVLVCQEIIRICPRLHGGFFREWKGHPQKDCGEERGCGSDAPNSSGEV